MDENHKNLIYLLERKRDKIKEVFDLTHTTVLGDTADGIGIYVELIEKRDVLIEEAKGIELELKETLCSLFPAQKEENPIDALHMDAKRIVEETDDIIRQIVALEEQNQPRVECMMNSIKKNLKQVKDNKAASNYYQNMGVEYKGQFLDKKK